MLNDIYLSTIEYSLSATLNVLRVLLTAHRLTSLLVWGEQEDSRQGVRPCMLEMFHLLVLASVCFATAGASAEAAGAGGPAKQAKETSRSCTGTNSGAD